MNRIRIGVLTAVAAIAFAACQGAATPAPSTAASPSAAASSGGASSAPSASPSAAASETPVEGGSLVVGIPGDMVLADPSLVK